MQRSTGIVLKRYMPKKQKCSLIDMRTGRIEAIMRDSKLIERVWPGMVLTYCLQKGSGVHLLEQVMFEAMPVHHTTRGIGFVHHLLELCYYFVPLEQVEPEVFQLVLFVVSHNQSYEYTFHIQIVAKFFWLIGLEIEALTHHHALQGLLALPLESMLKEQVDDNIYQMMVQWVYRCIHAHPQMASFKTMAFFTKYGAS